ncbi:MAG: 50S ribosomal protein L20 [Phycisphaerae bacterium]
MPRIKGGHASRKRRKRLLRAAKGYRASRSKLYRSAKQTLMKARMYGFRDRRAKKRNFRALWIVRITAACVQRGISYSKFIGGLKLANIDLNRKMLSEIAIFDPAAFDQIVDLAKQNQPAGAVAA